MRWLPLAFSLLACGQGAVAPSSSALTPALSPEAAGELSRAGVPVLLLPAEYEANLQAVGGEHFFSMTAVGDDYHSVLLQGTNVVHHPAPQGEAIPAPRWDVRGVPARTTMNEGQRLVTWGEAGAFYTLEVECHRLPMEDVRCTAPDFAMAIAERLQPFTGAAQ
ncbi:MAG: hypothetical protein AAF411_09260 [Myxococcota bacterium]